MPTRAERIENETEDVCGRPGPIRARHGLERQRAGGQDQVESAIRDFPGNRVFGRRIVFRIEALNHDGFAVFESSLGEAYEHPVDAFIQNRLRRMLKNGDAGDDLTALAAAVPVGQQQDADGERDEDQAEGKPSEDVDDKRS